MNGPGADAGGRVPVDVISRPTNGAGREEWTAAAFITLATVFFWWRGFRAFTVAGAILFVVALIQLGAHRRRVARDGASIERRTAVAGWWLPNVLAALIFPGLLGLQLLDAVSLPATAASADLWFGGLLYAVGLMELVELATLRALDEP